MSFRRPNIDNFSHNGKIVDNTHIARNSKNIKDIGMLNLEKGIGVG